MLKDHKSAMNLEGVTFDKVIRNSNETEQFPSKHGQMGPIWAESGHYAQIGPMWVPYRNFSPCGTHMGHI